jgi:hypothetical protein
VEDDRRHASGERLGVAAGMIVLALGLAIFRSVYLNALPAGVSHAAAAELYDTLVRYMRLWLRAVLVLLAFIEFLGRPSEPSPSAPTSPT